MRHGSRWVRRRWHRLRRFFARRVFHADDTPHVIALGISIGTFAAFLPILGFQMMLALAGAALIRANKVAAMSMTWITNPVTTVPSLYLCYTTGRWIVPTSWSGSENGLQRIVGLASDPAPLDPSFWNELGLALAGAGLELWVGSLVVAAIAAAIAYFPARWLVVNYRVRHKARVARRQHLRHERAQRKALKKATRMASVPVA